MAYQPAERNLTGVQFENVRKLMDAKFNTAHDQLSIAYYDYWKKGISHPWKTFDVQPTQAESKALFDKLHSLIFHLREIAFHNTNLSLPKKDRIDENKYRYIKNPETGEVIEDKLATITAKINALQAAGISFVVE